MDQNYQQPPHQPQMQPMGQPGPGYHPAMPAQGNGIAVAAMVLGIVSLALFFIPIVGLICGLIGFILGFSGLSKANRLGGKGKGMAIAGIVTGIIGTLIGAWVLIGLFLIADAAQDAARY